MQSATVPISLVSDLSVALAGQEALFESAVLEAGIAPELLAEAGGRVTVDQFVRFYRRLALILDDETPGFFSRPLKGGVLKYLCLGMLDAPNLHVALHRFAGFFRLVLDDVAFVIERGAAVTRISLVERTAPRAPRPLVCEVMLKLVHGVASWMIGRRIPLLQADFAYPRPSRGGEYLYLFPGAVTFDAPQSALSIASAFLDVPIRQDRKALSRFLARAPGDWMYVSFSERLSSHRVRDYLEGRLGRVMTLRAVAQALHYSPRTLARRLAEEGTSFQAVKDELRRDSAVLRLTKTNLPVALIGAELGFDDPGGFCRAFKVWTGSTPGAYRRRGF